MRAILLVLVFTLVGCSSYQKRSQINQEKSMTQAPVTTDEMVERMRDILDKSPNLSNKQKDSFIMLHGKVIGKTYELNNEIRKAKIVLIKHLASEKYDPIKVGMLQRDIKKMYNKKISIMMDAMADARKILGTEFKMLNDHITDSIHFGMF